MISNKSLVGVASALALLVAPMVSANPEKGSIAARYGAPISSDTAAVYSTTDACIGATPSTVTVTVTVTVEESNDAMSATSTTSSSTTVTYTSTLTEYIQPTHSHSHSHSHSHPHGESSSLTVTAPGEDTTTDSYLTTATPPGGEEASSTTTYTTTLLTQETSTAYEYTTITPYGTAGTRTISAPYSSLNGTGFSYGQPSASAVYPTSSAYSASGNTNVPKTSTNANGGRGASIFYCVVMIVAAFCGGL
ncbi:hypothetical protein QBC35DRAFT_490333, partial [Podospora australis]